MNSILNDIKDSLGISIDDTSFDNEIIMHINSSFMILNQLGAGPDIGFCISDSSETWDKYESNPIAATAIQTFIYIKVKLVFDPPTSATVVESLTTTANEYQWRIAERSSIGV